jgi:hypothetical protein
MLGDAELQDLSDKLNTFALASRTHHNIIQELLQKYQNLVESYRSLKSDYEEEKESREKYKKLARGQVCVLQENALSHQPLTPPCADK